MKDRWIGIASFVVAALILFFAAIVMTNSQAPVKQPTLTDVQKLQVQNVMQQLTIAGQNVQIAQQQFDVAKRQAEATLRSLVVDGWTLDMQKLEYVSTPQKESKR